MTAPELLRLRELLEKATRVTEWKWDGMTTDDEGYVWVPECSYLGPTSIALADTYENSGNDCAYIAAALTALPTLLSELDSLRAKVAGLEGDAARWKFVRDHWHDLCTATGLDERGRLVVEVFIGVGEHEPFAEGSLDAAIDAARLTPARADGGTTGNEGECNGEA